MKFAIHIDDMTADQMATVSAFLTSIGATPVSHTASPGVGLIAELAAATGAAVAAGARMVITDQPSPPPAPPFNYPSPGVPNVPNMPAAPTFDSRGLPHNPAFYADSKRTNADGSWAKRKGVDKAACEAWEASVPRGTPTAGQPGPAPAPSAAEINAKFAPGLAPQGVTPQIPQGDPFAAPVVTPPAPPAPPADITYAQWHSMYQSLLVAGKMSPEKYAEIAGRYGALEDVMMFMNNPAARAASYQEFQTIAAA